VASKQDLGEVPPEAADGIGMALRADR
jgi:hypothetical protein